MPEYSQAILGKAAGRSSQEEEDDDDDDEESDTKSVNSIQSAFSIRSNASKSSYLSAGAPRKLSRERRISNGPAQPNASTATQQTTAVAPAAQGTVATTQPKKGRGKKGRKAKGN